jgi:hypothetical protein
MLNLFAEGSSAFCVSTCTLVPVTQAVFVLLYQQRKQIEVRTCLQKASLKDGSSMWSELRP